MACGAPLHLEVCSTVTRPWSQPTLTVGVLKKRVKPSLKHTEEKTPRGSVVISASHKPLRLSERHLLFFVGYDGACSQRALSVSEEKDLKVETLVQKK